MDGLVANLDAENQNTIKNAEPVTASDAHESEAKEPEAIKNETGLKGKNLTSHLRTLLAGGGLHQTPRLL